MSVRNTWYRMSVNLKLPSSLCVLLYTAHDHAGLVRLSKSLVVKTDMPRKK